MSDMTFDPDEKFVVASQETHAAKPRPGAVARITETVSPHIGASHSRPQQPNGFASSNKQQPSHVANGNAVAAESSLTDNVSPPVAVRVAQKVNRLPLTIDFERRLTTSHEDVTLPSEFVSYDWKDIQVRRFNIEELRSIVRARTTGNLRHLVRAVDATLTRPVTELTQGDFWFIMYWHRINSYKKSPFVLDWTCTAKEHLEKIAQEMASPDSLRNLLTINKSNLETVSIDVEAYGKLADDIESEYGVEVRPQNVVDFISALDEDEEREFLQKREQERAKKRVGEAIEEADVDLFLSQSEKSETAGEEEDIAFMYRYAALIDAPTSLKERVEILNAQDPSLLTDLEAFLAVADHGVKESWKVTCKECGASKTIEQSLDALMFLPSLHRGGLA